MIAARPGLAARQCCPARLPSRLPSCRVRAAQQRPSAPQRSEPLAPQLLAALETAALALAVSGHTAALLAAQQQAASAAQAAAQQQQQQQQQRSSTARMAQAPAAAPPPPAGSWAAPGGAWLTLPLVAALALGRLRSWLARDSSAQRARSPSEQAVARLLRLEAGATQQAAQLEALARQLDKLSVRSRLVGRDFKLPLTQLQAAVAQQAEALVAVAQRMERLEKDVRDTEELVGAMQGVSAKQFQLLLKVLEQQQAAAEQAGPQQQQQQQQAAASASVPPRPQKQAADPAAGTGAVKAKSRIGGVRWSGGSSGKPGAAPWPYGAGAGRPQEDAGLAAGMQAAVDEWGRRVVPLPQSSALGTSPDNQQQQQQQQQFSSLPPVPNGGAASALSSDGGGGGAPEAEGPPSSSPATPDSFATGATLPEGLLAGLEALRGARGAGGGGEGAEGGKPGLSTQAVLDILDSDPCFRAERSMISALLNQPKKVERPGVEILPPLGPHPALPLDEDEQEEQRRLVEEWRERVARAWSMPPLESHAQGDAAEAQGEASEGAGDVHTADEGEAAPHDSPAPDVHASGNDDGGTTDHFGSSIDHFGSTTDHFGGSFDSGFDSSDGGSDGGFD